MNVRSQISMVFHLDKCIGCHICADVCPTGYIQMGLGD